MSTTKASKVTTTMDPDNIDEEALITSEAPESVEIMVTGNSDLQGDYDSNDIDFPKLGVAQAVGPLAEEWKKGDIVIDGDLKVGDLKNPVLIHIIKANKRYVEDLPYGGDEIPRTFNTKEEVFDAGGTITWGDGAPTFKAVMDCLVCIRASGEEWEQTGDTKGDGKWITRKGDTEASFPFDHDGENFLFATWRIKGASYKTAAKKVTQAAKFYYRESLSQGNFVLTTELVGRRDGGSYVVASLAKGSQNPDELRSWFKEFTA